MAVQMTERTLIETNDAARQDDVLSVDVRTKPFSRSGFSLNVRFTARAGITVLFGASGAGKTSVLDCIAGLTMPAIGRISIGERVLLDSSLKVNVPINLRRVGYVLQDLALFPHMTAGENICYGLAHLTSVERCARLEKVADSFAIAHVLERRPRDISGGESQRVALARALVTDPDLLLLDEPLSGLDLPTKSRIIDDLRTWNDAHRIPILYVTHDRSEVFALAEHVIAIEKGNVLTEGSPFDVLENPQHEAVAQLSGFENIFDAKVKALHHDRGTMTCMLGQVDLEVPLAQVKVGSVVRLGIRAGDILLATVRPEGLSARNILAGRIRTLSRRDVVTVAQVECGNATFEVHLTPHAQSALGLVPDREVWLVLKTHSCHRLRQ